MNPAQSQHSFLFSTVSIGQKKLFRILRTENIIKLTLENGILLLCATKTGRKYSIFLDIDCQSAVGSVSSNFLGTEYTLYDSSKELAVVLYEANVLGLSGPRKMTLILPHPEIESSQLLKKFKANRDDVLVLHNKKPMWNEESESFVLNFEGRVSLASVKNFQIVPDLDLALQFGKISPNSFTIDVQYPFSPLLAFGIALSAIDGKIACE